MVEISLAMATTHGPQLHTTVEQWQLRVDADKRANHPFRGDTYTYEDLVQLRKDEDLGSKSSMEAQQGYWERCQAGMKALAEKWDEAKPDIAVILGNDQNEVFKTEELNPSFMVFYGQRIPNFPQSEERRKELPPGIIEAEPGHATPDYTEYDGQPALGLHIIQSLMQDGFDVAASKVWPMDARNGTSHAFGHIYRQVMSDDVVPSVPIYQNTFFPPNQPTAQRSYEFGQAVKRALDSWESDLKIAVFGSGGMSHFVIDEVFDRKFVEALKAKDKAYLSSIPLSLLQSGTSELKSWISLAGLLEEVECTMHEVDYIPCYRSPAGTGTANGFYWWELN